MSTRIKVGGWTCNCPDWMRLTMGRSGSISEGVACPFCARTARQVLGLRGYLQNWLRVRKMRMIYRAHIH